MTYDEADKLAKKCLAAWRVRYGEPVGGVCYKINSSLSKKTGGKLVNGKYGDFYHWWIETDKWIIDAARPMFDSGPLVSDKYNAPSYQPF